MNIFILQKRHVQNKMNKLEPEFSPRQCQSYVNCTGKHKYYSPNVCLSVIMLTL